jgi:SAM-dependent methyltransferase
MSEVASESIDLVFMSNFLEHLEREAILKTLEECHRVLRSGGGIMILQPNIRFLSRDYWMFFDHVTPVDDRALVEAFSLVGFEPTLVRARFLPFTMQSRLPTWRWLVRLYLKLPIAQWIFGKQSLVEGKKQDG